MSWDFPRSEILDVLNPRTIGISQDKNMEL